MKEFYFNIAVVKRIEKLLLKTGQFEVIKVGSETRDMPLGEIVSNANKTNADIFVSIHANAFGSGGWNSVTGIETFNCPGSSMGPKLARLVQDELIKATGMISRGVKEKAFYVIRYTTMPAILSENGFMTNKRDAQKLLDENYRDKIAMAHAVAICKYFNIDYSILFEDSEKEKQDKKIQDCLAIINEIDLILEKLRNKLKS
ncbi:MAG: N-acetylmuramoyl-L-alanine amidase LytC precursor [Candidatus Izimaplasma bacterium HR2]|nr:MAG: N-acetylmuramoyl-L-alanine amidase LytC precursor [Candidatus Izimaplasma bacterium HR2]